MFANYSLAGLIYFLLTPILDVMDQAGTARLQASEQRCGDLRMRAAPLSLSGRDGMARLPPPPPPRAPRVSDGQHTAVFRRLLSSRRIRGLAGHQALQAETENWSPRTKFSQPVVNLAHFTISKTTSQHLKLRTSHLNICTFCYF